MCDPTTHDVPEIDTQIAIRPLECEEALALMQKGESLDPVTRKRTAILLASLVGCTTSQIAAMHTTQLSEVCKTITDYNECGIASLDFPA